MLRLPIASWSASQPAHPSPAGAASSEPTACPRETRACCSQANLRRAYNQFNEEILESCAKQAEYRSIVFALCYFHAALLERKKFGVGNLPGATSGIGWNMNYPFNAGDLLCCGQTANNYLENNVKVRAGSRLSGFAVPACSC